MASIVEKGSSSSGRGTTTPLMPGRIVVAYDATKSHNVEEVKGIIGNVQKQDGMIQEVDTITVLGILHKVLHPMGFQIQIGNQSFIGAHARAIKEDVSRKIDAYVGKLQHIAEECAGKRVNLEVKIVVGAPVKKAVVHEVDASNATWVIIDRQLRKELSYYFKHVSCKIAAVLDNLSLEILRPYHNDKAVKNVKHKHLYSLSRRIPPAPTPDNDNEGRSVIPESYQYPSSQTSPDNENNSPEKPVTSEFQNSDGLDSRLKNSVSTGITAEVKEQKEQNDSRLPIIQKQINLPSDSEIPATCTDALEKSEPDSTKFDNPAANDFTNDISHGGGDAQVESESDFSNAVQTPLNHQMDLDLTDTFDLDVIKMEEKALGCNYHDIKLATNDFSFDNLLGEGPCGVVYKGQFKDGQLIVVKVQKSSPQSFREFQSEVDAVRLALHKNIVMLIGYCSRENSSMLVYEYICNRSLEWHLFDNPKHVLQWYQRHSIAIGIAKGLRFLHEECRGSPIVHRDMRPSNILLTHDFVPLLGDYGLANWKTSKSDLQTRVLGSLGYLAPEFAENGSYSVKSDVYAFGIVLIQLISGCKAVDSTRDDPQPSLRQWGLALIEKLAVDELIDPRLGDSYSMYELYNMARAACLCLQPKPAMRPTMGEVLYLLEGQNDHLCLLTEIFEPFKRNLQNQP